MNLINKIRSFASRTINVVNDSEEKLSDKSIALIKLEHSIDQYNDIKDQLDEIVKGKKANIGEVHTWSDGKKHEKTEDGWVEISNYDYSNVENDISDDELLKLLRVGDKTIKYLGLDIPVKIERENYDKYTINIWLGGYDFQGGRQLVMFNKKYDSKDYVLEELRNSIVEIHETFVNRIESKKEINEKIKNGSKYVTNFNVKTLIKEHLSKWTGEEINAMSGSDYLNYAGKKLRFSDHTRPPDSKWNFIHGENHIDSINGLLNVDEVVGWLDRLTDGNLSKDEKKSIKTYFEKEIKTPELEKIDLIKGNYTNEDEWLFSLLELTNQFEKSKQVLKESIQDITKALQTDGDFEYKKYMGDCLNRSRDSMPQIEADQLDELILHFSGKSKNAKVKKKTVKISDLKPTQNEINEEKVLKMLKEAVKGKIDLNDKYVVSKDNYLLDGHHRYAALLELNPEQEVTVYKINLPINELLRRVNLMKIAQKLDIYNKEIKKAVDDHTNNQLLTVFEDDFEKGKYSKEQLKELIDEHEHLVDVMESASKQDDEKEKKKQKKELKEYKKDLEKGAQALWSGTIDGKQKTGYWKTISGSHVLVNSSGEIIEGAKMEISSKKDENNKKSNNSENGNKISHKESQAIVNYTGSSYRMINNGLRKGNNDETLLNLEKTINSGLDKLPSFEGKVYRAESAYDDLEVIADHYNEAGQIEFAAFTSTTSDKNITKSFGGNVFFEIKSKNGKDIADYSSMSHEKEVLFKSKTNFKVKKVTLKKVNGVAISLNIKLEEV